MSLNATVKARVETSLKQDFEIILKEIGLNSSQAFKLFMKKVVSEKGIPFDLKIPNDITLKAMEEAKNMEGERISFEDLKKEHIGA
ncbi:MAG: type II toxin-antitoxin system RelB/DinJ family antitoxin [Helicobacteraceae bacterium]|nr:type II toxin-antitoxin system RelB/DinJ family antitoxin [Helicobacteraceae bacterium]